MPFSLQIKKTALKVLARVMKADRVRIVKAIDRLVDNPHVGKVLKGELSGLRRIRAGHYRIVYEINEEEVMILVVRVAHRRKVYQ